MSFLYIDFKRKPTITYSSHQQALVSFAATFASHAWPVLMLIRGHFFVVGDFVRLKIFYSCFLTKYPRWLEWPECSTQWPVWETTPSVLIMRYLCILSSVYLSFSILFLAKFKEFAGKKITICVPCPLLIGLVNWSVWSKLTFYT